MIKIAIVMSMVCLTISVCSSVPAATIHIKWDPSVTGGYYRISAGKVDFSHARVSKEDLAKHRHEDLTADLPDGHYHLEGPGFKDTLQVRDGKITFRENVPAFKNDRGTITFNTAALKIDLNGYEQNVTLEGVTPVLDKATRIHAFKVVCGNQKLDYDGGTLTVAIDAKGSIRLPDNPGGFAVDGDTVRLQPRQYTFDPAASVVRWGLGRAPDLAAGPQKVKLLPTTGRYLLTVDVTGQRPSKFDLRINSSFQVSTRSGGQFTEHAEVKPDGAAAALVSISLLGGKQIVKDSLATEPAARQSSEIVSRDSLAAWHQDFQFSDAMQIYPFPEELVAYRVKFPAGKIRASELALLALNDQKAVSLPLQLSDVVQSDGFLAEATVQFRASLPLGQKRLYRLTAGYQAPSIDAPPVPIRLDTAGENTANLITDLLRLQVPTGRLDFKPAKPLAQVPAAILGLTRIGGATAPAVTGAFVAPNALVVDSMESNLLETGPLLARYRVAYHLQGNKTYAVTLTLRTAESYITVDEKLAGFTAADGAFWQIRFASLHPTMRQAMSGGGYERYAGSYDKDAEPTTGKLPFILGLYGPNSLGVVRSAAFWDDSGPDALLVCLNRLRDWQTNKREIWITRGPDMLQFFARNKGQNFRARLEGSARYWALGLVPRETMVNRPVIDTRSKQVKGAGPEVRLCQKLGDFSLNAWKDRVIDFDEKLDPGPFADQEEVSYDQWIKSHGNFAKLIANQYWDSGAVGAPAFKGATKWFGSYARSRAKWTPEQRRRVRAILLFCAYVCEDDNGFPHHSMLAGHPNFIADVKGAIAVACETFPNHPDVKRWRDSFMSYLTEWLDTFQRSADPEHNARGGRWTENIAGYSGASLRTLLGSCKAMAAYDGTDLINSTHHVADWVRWYRDAIMSPHDGQRLVPPQGAHSHAFETDSPKSPRDSLFEVAALLAKSNPRLASEMLWIKTNGKEGTNPKAASCLYVDYGPIFHYDFGGPNESYATMQNITGRSYRWKAAGIVYYGAKGKVWSYNGADDNGDQFSWDKLSAFSIQGEGLEPSPTNQLLYDFGFAQFYRIQGEPPYLSRGLMLVRDDYIALVDEVSPGAPEGQFVWASLFQMPQIYQLKPGAAAIETTSSEGSPVKGPRLRISHQQKYVGKGDFLTVVAPAAVQAQTQPFGATVNGEYVFASQKPEAITEAAVVFAGNYGYARPNQLALFQGTKIGLGGFELRREGGDFGLSAVMENSRIAGRIVGRSGGKVFVVPPGELNPAGASVTVNGKPVPHTVQQGAVAFLVDIAQRDGLKSYEIQFGK